MRLPGRRSQMTRPAAIIDQPTARSASRRAAERGAVKVNWYVAKRTEDQGADPDGEQDAAAADATAHQAPRRRQAAPGGRPASRSSLAMKPIAVLVAIRPA